MRPLEIPGRGTLSLAHLVLDLNGTLTVDGALLPGVAERLQRLRAELTLHLVTADTRGMAAELAARLGLMLALVPPGEEAAGKRARVEALLGGVVAIGNGANDAAMLRAATLGIAVLGAEGLATDALLAADVLVRDIGDALDLLLDPGRLIATLRV